MESVIFAQHRAVNRWPRPLTSQVPFERAQHAGIVASSVVTEMEGHQMLRHTAIIGLALVGAVCAANAADLPRAMPVKAPPPLPLFTWNGFYIGVSAGGKWADIDHTVTSGATTFTFNDSRASSWLAGGQIGYNWQAPGSSWVFGVEGDIHAQDFDRTLVVAAPIGPFIAGDSFRVQSDWQ